MRYWMILLIPVHVDHNPVERADTRHDLTVSVLRGHGEIYSGLVLDLSDLDLEEIGNALADQTDYEHQWLINPHTGEIRRFKDELHEEYSDLLAAWHAFREIRAKRRAVQWLADNSLIDDDVAGRFLADHPDPDLS